MKNIQQLNQTNIKGYYITAFFVMLLTTTFLALNFIPLLTKTGNSNAETADVSVEIDPVLSLTLSENEITLNPNPVPEGTFIHDTLSAIVDTNNKTGYTLTMNSETEETSLSQEDGVTKIDSLADEVTVTSADQSNFTMNHWGYALAETVAESDTTFNKIPALSAPATIKTSDAPVLDDATPVTLATRVDTSLPSGTYKSTLVFSATANFIPTVTPPENTSALTQALADADAEFQEALDGTNYYTMQSMTSDICNAVSTPTKEEIDVPEATLIDTRDQELYTVRKLADGNCWMSQNLRLQLSTAKPLTSADSDVATTWTPTYNTQTTTGTVWGDPSANEARSYVDTANKDIGGYYTWYAATAGQGSYSMSTSGENTTTSICPKGWQLPEGYNSMNKAFGEITDAYYGYDHTLDHNNTIYSAPLSIVLSGVYDYYDGQVSRVGNEALLWSSTVNYADEVYYLSVYSSYVALRSSNSKAEGLSVRCVAR